jgi:tyrosine-specific transport protein
MNKKFWATTFTLTGTIVRAGILGLPYVFEQSGFLISLFWLITIGAVMIFVNLTLGEITLRTRGRHQLPGYAKKYLGKWGKRLMLTAVLFGIYSALLAYLVGEGQSLSKLISPNTPPIIFGIIFWAILTLLLRGGLKELKKVETWGVIAVISIVLSIFLRFLPSINPHNLLPINNTNFAVPIGVVMFALLGFTSIPELRKEIKGQEKLLKRAIVIGTTIPIFLYTIFSATFIGVLGSSISQVATLSFGPLMTILGIFTMFTSYFVLSYSLSATFRLDLKTKKRKNFIFTSLVPLILYILAEYFQRTTFTFILGIGGVISGGITGILILLMAYKAKSSTRSKKDPEIQMPINIPLIILISIVFVSSIILELLP